MCRCVESFSGGTAPEERQTAGLPTLVTAPWLTALITPWQCAWTMWRAAAPERSVNTFTLLLICRHASKAPRAHRALLQPLLWWGSVNTCTRTHITVHPLHWTQNLSLLFVLTLCTTTDLNIYWNTEIQNQYSKDCCYWWSSEQTVTPSDIQPQTHTHTDCFSFTDVWKASNGNCCQTRPPIMLC